MFVAVSVLPVRGFSRLQRVRISLPAPISAKIEIDSIARSIPGVYTAQWKAKRQYLFVAYDRTRTTKKRIIASFMHRFQKENHNFANNAGTAPANETITTREYEEDLDDEDYDDFLDEEEDEVETAIREDIETIISAGFVPQGGVSALITPEYTTCYSQAFFRKK